MIQTSTGAAGTTPDIALIRQFTRNLHVILTNGLKDEYESRLKLAHNKQRQRHCSRTQRDLMHVAELAGMVHARMLCSRETCTRIADAVVFGTPDTVPHLVACELANEIRREEVQRD